MATPPPSEWPTTVAWRDAEFVEQIAEKHRERAQRVVAAGFRRLAVAQQVRRDHPEFLRQLRYHRPPGVRTSRHAVDQQQHFPVTVVAVGHPIAVQFQELQLVHFDGVPPLVLTWTPDDPDRDRKRQALRRARGSGW